MSVGERRILVRRALKILALTAALSVGGSSGFVQQANAEQRTLSRSILTVGSDTPAEDQHKFRASQRAKPTVRAVQPAPELLYLSEAYIKKEQQTEDRLKRIMKICTGC